MSLNLNTATAAQLNTYRETVGGVISLDFSSGAKIPRTTNGAGVDSLTETTTNKINADLLVFDPATKEYAQAWFIWPQGWATCKATFYTKPTSGTGSFVLGAQVRVYTDGDAIDSAFGTAQEVTDAAASAETVRQSSATAAITPSGTVAGGKLACLQVYRDPANGSDDHAVDLPLLHVKLECAD